MFYRFCFFMSLGLFCLSSSPSKTKAPAPKTVAPKTVAPKTVAPKTVAPKTVAPTAPPKASAPKKKIDIDGLLKKMDELFRKESSVAEVTMTIENPKWPSARSIALKIWSKGEDLSLVKILSPKKDKGIGTLKIKKDIWNYFPKISKQIKIPASMMMGSWMGSDFTNDDLVKESSYKNDFKTTASEDDKTYTLNLVPQEKTISIWDKIEMIINKKSLLPLEYRFFNERKEKIRTLTFSAVKTFSGSKLPSKLTMISHTEKGKKTTLTYEKMDFSKKLSQDFFSFHNLKKK